MNGRRLQNTVTDKFPCHISPVIAGLRMAGAYCCYYTVHYINNRMALNYDKITIWHMLYHITYSHVMVDLWAIVLITCNCAGGNSNDLWQMIMPSCVVFCKKVITHSHINVKSIHKYSPPGYGNFHYYCKWDHLFHYVISYACKPIGWKGSLVHSRLFEIENLQKYSWNIRPSNWAILVWCQWYGPFISLQLQCVLVKTVIFTIYRGYYSSTGLRRIIKRSVGEWIVMEGAVNIDVIFRVAKARPLRQKTWLANYQWKEYYMCIDRATSMANKLVSGGRKSFIYW